MYAYHYYLRTVSALFRGFPVTSTSLNLSKALKKQLAIWKSLLTAKIPAGFADLGIRKDNRMWSCEWS